MGVIVRWKLDKHAQGYLDKKTAEVLAAVPADRADLAREMWKGARKTVAFQRITKKLRRMSPGLYRCMYCEDSAGVAIDHFWPLARYPHKAFRWKNYLYACTWCNSNEKRDRFPVGWVARKPLLMKPTLDDPLHHLDFDPSTGEFKARTPKGAMSIQVFGLNARPDLPAGRLNALLALQLLIGKYAEMHAQGQVGDAAEVERVVRQYPFASVLCHLVAIAGGPAATSLRPDFLAALVARPEIRGWV